MLPLVDFHTFSSKTSSPIKNQTSQSYTRETRFNNASIYRNISYKMHGSLCVFLKLKRTRHPMTIVYSPAAAGIQQNIITKRNISPNPSSWGIINDMFYQNDKNPFVSLSYSFRHFVLYSAFSRGRCLALLTRIMSKPMFTREHIFEVLLVFKTRSNNFHCTSNENGHHFVPLLFSAGH